MALYSIPMKNTPTVIVTEGGSPGGAWRGDPDLVSNQNFLNFPIDLNKFFSIFVLLKDQNMPTKPNNPVKTFLTSQKIALELLTRLLTKHQDVLSNQDLQALSDVFVAVNKRKFKK